VSERVMHGYCFSTTPHDSSEQESKVVSRKNNKKVEWDIQGNWNIVPDDQISASRTEYRYSMPEM